MPTIDDLSSYVAAEDEKGFLLCFMQLVDEGANLSVPSSLELAKIQAGWEEIIPNITGGYSDEFIEKLSKYWLTIITKQGAKVTKTFAKEIIAIIQNKPKPKAEPEADSTKSATSTPTSPAPALEAQSTPAPAAAAVNHGALDTVASNISEHYYSYQNAMESDVLPKDDLLKSIKQALQFQQVDNFLIHYLSFARYQEKVKVPMTSVSNKINEKWEEILMEQFDLKPTKEYLKNLSTRWFYLVNQKGLPATLEKLQDMLYFIMANRAPETKTTTTQEQSYEGKVSGSFFTKIKSMFS